MPATSLFGFVAMIAGEDRPTSATDLARAWEAVPDLHRRGQVLQLVSKRSDSCNSPMKIMFWVGLKDASKITTYHIYMTLHWRPT